MKPLMRLASFLSALMLASGAYAQGESNRLIGSQLYRSYCLVCHGADGGSKGAVALKLDIQPSDLSAGRYQSMGVEALADVIASYRKQQYTNMPNWGLVLPRIDLLDIAAYVATITRRDLAFRGDSRRGRVIFKNACVACHGKVGRGEGPLAGLFRIDMKDFAESAVMTALSDDELIKVIREGKGEFMPAWKETLNEDEIVDVASYVRMLAR